MTTEIEQLRGVAHIALTPFLDDERLDLQSIPRIVEATVAAGCGAVVPLAIMGEAKMLLEDERDTVLQAYVAAADGALPVIPAVSGESTVVVVDRARRAARFGADAVMVAPPRGATAGDRLLAHYAAVAAATDLPVVVQDEPVTTGVRLPSEFFADLASLDGVFAAKVEESPSPPKIAGIRRAAPELSCFGGLGGISLVEELGRGAVGIMTGFGFPEILSSIVDAYQDGDVAGAEELFFRFLPLIRFEAQLGVGGVGVRKQVFHDRGIITTPTARRPVVPIDQDTVRELRHIVDVLGLGTPA